MTESKLRKLVVGAGYVGHRVAQQWHRQGHHVDVVTRSSVHAEQFASAGLNPIQADITDPTTLKSLVDYETVLFSVGFDRTAGVAQHTVYVDGLGNLLTAIPHIKRRFIYLSSTGVYAQTGDVWVDETSICEPTREGGKCCLAAEHLLRAHAHGRRAIVFRLAGIYGPGRIPFLDRLRQRQPLPVRPDGYLNLIHVDDVVDLILQAEGWPAPDLYAIADGHPVHRASYYEAIARHLNVPVHYTEPDPGSPQAQRASSSKRISTQKLQSQIDRPLRFPTFRDGLKSALQEDEAGQTRST